MKKPEKRLSAKETLEILNNQWADVNDVMKIGFVGTTSAQKIMRNIKNKLLEDGKKTPGNLVPMEKVKDYFEINISYLKKISKD